MASACRALRRHRSADADAIDAAAAAFAAAERPLILAGGGAKRAAKPLRRLAETLGAPVVPTANARGLLHAPSARRSGQPQPESGARADGDADLVIAAGTEFGPTDYDMYGDGGFVMPSNLIRIDIDADQLAAPAGDASAIQADCAKRRALLAAIGAGLDPSGRNDGAARAEATRKAALAELSPTCATRCVRSRRSASLAGRHHRRRFDAAGLCRQPLLRS